MIFITVYILSAIGWWYFVHLEAENGWDTGISDVFVMFTPVLNTFMALLAHSLRLYFKYGDKFSFKGFVNKFFNVK